MMRTILNSRRVLPLLLAALAPAALLAACGDDDDAASGSGGSGPAVLATTTQVADLARNVAGDRAEVVGILAPNADPHDYEPRPSDAEALADADLVIQSGGDLDIWIDELVESSGSDASGLALIDSVRTIEGSDGEDAVDPHWWQDPTNAIRAVDAIQASLIEADPEGATEYERNAEDYAVELEAARSPDRRLHRRGGGRPSASWSPATTRSATSPTATGSRWSGSTIPALTTQAQPSAGETAELVELIERERVKAVFPEAGVSTELEQAIADETGAAIGAELWADALGPEGSPGETYVGRDAPRTQRRSSTGSAAAR